METHNEWFDKLNKQTQQVFENYKDQMLKFKQTMERYKTSAVSTFGR